jgi:hypothetical protein
MVHGSRTRRGGDGGDAAFRLHTGAFVENEDGGKDWQ